MANFGTQAAIRSKWTDLVESSTFEVPDEVSSGVRSVVGWLKQVKIVHMMTMHARPFIVWFSDPKPVVKEKTWWKIASLEVKQAGLRTLSSISSNMATGAAESLTILHFNDVYNIESGSGAEPVGGAARFCSAIKSFSHLQPLILFSGDIFSPSILSTFTKGEQMVPVLNECGTHCAVFGNHDFDFGLEVLADWVEQTKFPWLMSNVIDNETGRPLADGKITHVVNWSGKRIGLMGLVEQEWLETLATINPEEVTFIDFVEAGKQLGAQLKKEGCDYVIALTHMRTPNDIKLAENVDEVDLILGGHDHVYEVQLINNKYVIKSGTDFRQFSKITLTFPSGTLASSSGGKGPVDVKIEEVNVTSAFQEDAQLCVHLEKYAGMVEGRMDEVLGKFSVELDGRFASIRSKETNLGNWVADVALAATGADLVLLNSGTLRSDRIHPVGEFTLRDLMDMLPMMDPLVILSITGEEIIAALENGVSQYPKLEGRFPLVAGVSFAFDPLAPPGRRVDQKLVRVGDEYLSPTQRYRLATKAYIYSGRDGYDVMKKARLLVDEEGSPELRTAIQNHFQAIKVRLGKTRRHSKHRQSLVTLSRRHSLVKMLEGSELDGPSPIRACSLGPESEPDEIGPHHHSAGPHHHPVHPARPRLTRRASLDDLEQESCELHPRVEGRIVLLTPERRQELLEERQRLEADSVIVEVDESSPQESQDHS